MIKRTSIALLGILAVSIASILVLGYAWSRTEHGILDYKTALLSVAETRSGRRPALGG